MENINILNVAVELLHLIFDYCNTETIFSARHVCKQLYSATNTYNRFRLVFNSKSKHYLKYIYHYIPSEHIISLTFSNDKVFRNSIDEFFTLFNIDRLNRLRSVILHNINDVELTYFFEHMTNHSQISLSINSSERQHTETLRLISLEINRFKLSKLYLNDLNNTMEHISWINQCGLECLAINTCDYRQCLMILYQLPHLQTIIMKDCRMLVDNNGAIDLNFDLSFSSTLKSLIIDDNLLSIQNLERLFSILPKLLHVKLSSRREKVDSIFDGSSWEQLIQTKLPLLKKFEIFFSYKLVNKDDPPSLHSLIHPFQTPFWIEQKRWFINCEYVIKLNEIRVYTVPNTFINSDNLFKLQLSSMDYIYRSITPSTNEMIDNNADEV